MNSSENGARQNPSENQFVHHFPSQNSQTHCRYTGIYRVYPILKADPQQVTLGHFTKLPPWAWSWSPPLAPWPQALVQWLVDFGRGSSGSCPRTVQWRKMWRRFSWKCPQCYEILMKISTNEGFYAFLPPMYCHLFRGKMMRSHGVPLCQIQTSPQIRKQENIGHSKWSWNRTWTI